ncbi:MAG: LytTR family DNA-binding domain-containing protein [Bacteroidales bacterium]|jgi:two-component system LytT family response regulator|nr:LytTR family DNA-binding domain-containing protein [Bacteroidales bacterium]
MKVLIIEDELLNVERLKLLICKSLPKAEVLGVLQTVAESVEWFSENVKPDVVFLDIHLADGSAFSIFEKVKVNCPIIFTTAYDEYALKAFEVNSIDYLLKPIECGAFERAVNKLKDIYQHNIPDNGKWISELIHMMKEVGAVYKSSLLVSAGDKLIPLPVKEIGYLFFESKTVNVMHVSGKNHVIHSSLDDIWKQLDPANFYHANRQFIIAKWAVKDVSLWFGNRVVVNLKMSTPEHILISRAHVQRFKKWLTE